MTLEPGRTLLNYRLTEQIGEGGMGVVWKAHDTTLDREVAIKILPAAVSEDRDRLGRFEREAKLLASLNHPNIATVHGLHHADDVHFLAMELVRGEDLSRRLDRGALAVGEALGIARQIAEALEAAHQNGVIHRDLKPANVQITPEGQVKVLDFGLAKAFEPDPSSANVSPTMSPTLTSAGTVAGMILGTAAYMSPEQARGHAADKRADIWAFGVLLYEMLCGRQAFEGETISDTLAGVLKIDPDWGVLPAGVPKRVRRLLSRCLHKDRKQRLHDIADARIVIEEELSGAPDEEAATETVVLVGKRERLLWAVAVVVAGVLGAVLMGNLGSAPETALRKFELNVPDLVSGYDRPPVISPDGRHLAYIAAGRLWVRDLERLEGREVPGGDRARAPFWSPDGSFVAWSAGAKLWKAPADGGEATAICDAPTADGASWSTDDRIVFAPGRGPMLVVSARGGDPETILDIEAGAETDFHKPHFLPDGRSFLFAIHRVEGIDTLGVFDGEQRKILLQIEGARIDRPVYDPSGHIVYNRAASNAGIWAVPFSLSNLELTGEPFLVAPDGAWPSVAADGTLVFVLGESLGLGQIAWVDREGKSLGKIGQPQPMPLFPAISPDSRRVSIAVQENENWDIWVHDTERDTRTRLTFDDQADYVSAWTEDGERLLFSTGLPAGTLDLAVRAADGTGDRRVLIPGMNHSVSKSGNIVVFTEEDDQGNGNLAYFRLDEEGTPEPVTFVATAADEEWSQLSPDARHVAYVSNESGRREVYITEFPSGEGKWQVSIDGGSFPRWSSASGEIFFVNDDTVMVVDVETRPKLVLGRPRELFKGRPNGIQLAPACRYDVTPDGQRFVVVLQVGDTERPPGITVVQNWLSEF